MHWFIEYTLVPELEKLWKWIIELPAKCVRLMQLCLAWFILFLLLIGAGE